MSSISYRSPTTNQGDVYFSEMEKKSSEEDFVLVDLTQKTKESAHEIFQKEQSIPEVKERNLQAQQMNSLDGQPNSKLNPSSDMSDLISALEAIRTFQQGNNQRLLGAFAATINSGRAFLAHSKPNSRHEN